VRGGLVASAIKSLRSSRFDIDELETRRRLTSHEKSRKNFSAPSYSSQLVAVVVVCGQPKWGQRNEIQIKMLTALRYIIKMEEKKT
jgi:hypothetical protein